MRHVNKNEESTGKLPLATRRKRVYSSLCPLVDMALGNINLAGRLTNTSMTPSPPHCPSTSLPSTQPTGRHLYMELLNLSVIMMYGYFSLSTQLVGAVDISPLINLYVHSQNMTATLYFSL